MMRLVMSLVIIGAKVSFDDKISNIAIIYSTEVSIPYCFTNTCL